MSEIYKDLDKLYEKIEKIENENKRLHSIIKEVREYIETKYISEFKDNFEKPFILTDKNDWNKVLEILDKGE